MNIIYFGYNSFLKHKRGVENVIEFQSNTFPFIKVYYIHWGSINGVYKSNKFISISIKNCWYWPIILNLLLIKIHKKNKFFIHSHNPIFSFFTVFKTNLFTVHDGLFYLSKQRNHKLKYLFYLIEYINYYRCEYVHFISDFSIKQSLFGSRSNYKVIPNTSHFEPFHNINIVKKSIINANKNTSVLIVRSIEERARFDLIIELAKKTINSKFIFNVVGKGPLLKSYQDIVENSGLNNLVFHGYLDDKTLLEYYLKCDLVLMIAEFGEGFGLPVIEAYLFNKPVIASNKCAIPEIIFSKEYLFENSVESIIEKINFIIKTESNMVDFHEYYINKYSNKVVFAEYHQLYNKLFLK